MLYVTEFLKMATDKYDCYWLTTHCQQGDTAEAMKYLSGILESEAIEYCRKTKPTQWKMNKAEALDLSSDFLWFEDAPSEIEKEILSEKGKLKNLVIVDAISNPEILKQLVKLL